MKRRERRLKKILEKILHDEEVEILYYDEAFFKREGTITRSWYLRGEVPQIESPATFDKIGVCAAVSPRDGNLFSLLFDGFDSNTFIYYLKWLMETIGVEKKIVLIVDNASSHRSLKVREFVEKYSDCLELVYLPPYSPDLNPIERVWKHLRYHVTHNRYFESFKSLVEAIIGHLNKYSQPNDQLRKLCCIN